MPNNRTALIAAIVALGTGPCFAQSPVLEAEAGQWQQVRSSGMIIYQTSQKPGAAQTSFSVDCDHAHTLDQSWTGITLTLNGKMLPPGAPLTLTVGGQSFTFSANKGGGISTDSPENARKFRDLWPLLRQGESVNVTAADGNTATLSLDGTAQLMPPEPCETRYE